MAEINTEEQKMICYFAYGSNMDIDHVNCWCQKKKLKPINPTEICPAKLEGYELRFNYFSKCNWKAGAANIMRVNNNCVYGLLMLLNESELRNVREKEGCKNPKRKGAPNCYDEITVDVEQLDTGRKVSNVITYKAAKHKEKDTHQPPTKRYMELLIKNAKKKKYNFPSEYIRYLESIKTKSEEEEC